MNFAVKMHILPFCTINTNISVFRWMLNVTLKLHTLHFWLITPTRCSQQTLQILSSWTISLVYMFKKTVVMRPQMAYRFTGKDSCKVTKSAGMYLWLHVWKNICSNHNIYLFIYLWWCRFSDYQLIQVKNSGKGFVLQFTILLTHILTPTFELLLISQAQKWAPILCKSRCHPNETESFMIVFCSFWIFLKAAAQAIFIISDESSFFSQAWQIGLLRYWGALELQKAMQAGKMIHQK